MGEDVPCGVKVVLKTPEETSGKLVFARKAGKSESGMSAKDIFHMVDGQV